jgi:Zn-dependent protease with chaperone function
LNFFEQQSLARRNSRRLVLWYALAACAVVASYVLAAALAYAVLGMYGLPLAGDAPLEWNGLWGTYFSALARVPWKFHAWIVGLVGACIALGTCYRLWQLSDGGPAIAELLGARYVESGRSTPAERKLLNVIEEMSIASGIAVPPVYVLDGESAINALVAGHSPNEAVIIVTEGALRQLSRDELQGVMGHEFSHILNGDMALNVRLVGILAGLTWLGERGEALVLAQAEEMRRVRLQERGGIGALVAVFGTLLAFIGFPGTLAADAIKAAISREREFLADAASVQFTRNPDGIAGALDTIVAVHGHTTIPVAYAGPLSHMFFATAVEMWWDFPTHPPIKERIRRAHPRFMREDYRARRHGATREVAVLDGSGNIVEHLKSGPAHVMASVGRPTVAHLDFGARLLAELPQGLREALRSPAQAEAAMFALLLGSDPRRGAEARALEARRGADALAGAAALQADVGVLNRQYMLTLAGLAVPAIKEQPQKARDRFLADFEALVQADGRVTLREFVLLTFLRQRLRESAGQPISTKFQRIEEVLPDAHIVLSMVALAAGEGQRAAFDKGAAVLGSPWREPVAAAALTTHKIGDALERIRQLSPFAKPALLKACVEAAAADGLLRVAEVELVRMVAATLDCPIPPLIDQQDPRALAA